MSRSDGSTHAIVIGASMAGLGAARVLTDHVDHVTILERDQLPAEPAYRKGVPQGRHAHVLLAAGQRAGSPGSLTSCSPPVPLPTRPRTWCGTRPAPPVSAWTSVPRPPR